MLTLCGLRMLHQILDKRRMRVLQDTRNALEALEWHDMKSA